MPGVPVLAGAAAAEFLVGATLRGGPARWLGGLTCLVVVVLIARLVPAPRPARPGRAAARVAGAAVVGTGATGPGAAGVDLLTGLADRHGFLDRAARFLAEVGCPSAEGGRVSRGVGALMLIDLDCFNEVNGGLGHERGDRLLVEVSRRLDAAGRPGDLLARIGGDEFAMMLRGVDDESVGAVVTRFRDALNAPVLLAGMQVSVEASIGIAIAFEHGRDVDELLRNAVSALREAKKSRTGYRVYDAGCLQPSPARLRLRTELRTCVQAGQLELRYQPKAELHTGRVTGVEALVRWRHPVDGVRPPDVFLPEMESAGLMPQLTRLVLATAVADCARWRAAGAGLSVSVNVPASMIADPALVPEVRAALTAMGLPPAALCVEITEDSLMTRRELARQTLRELRALGVRISLDDYGSGYCSLAYLRELPADELKLDRAFLRDIGSDPAAAEIVRSTIALAHTLGLRMVVEGVETARVWELLAAWGCDEVQGYFISRPMAGDQMLPWLRQWAGRTRQCGPHRSGIGTGMGTSRGTDPATAIAVTRIVTTGAVTTGHAPGPGSGAVNRSCVQRGSAAPTAGPTHH